MLLKKCDKCGVIFSTKYEHHVLIGRTVGSDRDEDLQPIRYDPREVTNADVIEFLICNDCYEKVMDYILEEQ